MEYLKQNGVLETNSVQAEFMLFLTFKGVQLYSSINRIFFTTVSFKVMAPRNTAGSGVPYKSRVQARQFALVV